MYNQTQIMEIGHTNNWTERLTEHRFIWFKYRNRLKLTFSVRELSFVPSLEYRVGILRSDLSHHLYFSFKYQDKSKTEVELTLSYSQRDDHEALK